MAIACDGKTVIDTGPPNLNPTDDESDCPEGNPPEIISLTCTNSGIRTIQETGEEAPTLTVTGELIDKDGALDKFIAELYVDAEFDGVISESAELLRTTYRANVGDCRATSDTVNYVIFFRGFGPAYKSTTYEWGLTLEDATGEVAENVVIECTTPNEDGTGDP